MPAATTEAISQPEFLALIRKAHRLITRLGGPQETGRPAVVAVLAALAAAEDGGERSREIRGIVDIIHARCLRRGINV